MEKALLPSAQAIEKGEEHYADSGSNDGIKQKAERKHRHAMGQQGAFGDGQHHLMEMEEDEDESEAGDGMLCVDSRADGRGDIADARFCDAIHADGIVVAERVLRDADRRAEEHAAYRIASADAEINSDEQRQID